MGRNGNKSASESSVIDNLITCGNCFWFSRTKQGHSCEDEGYTATSPACAHFRASEDLLLNSPVLAKTRMLINNLSPEELKLIPSLITERKRNILLAPKVNVGDLVKLKAGELLQDDNVFLVYHVDTSSVWGISPSGVTLEAPHSRVILLEKANFSEDDMEKIAVYVQSILQDRKKFYAKLVKLGEELKQKKRDDEKIAAKTSANTLSRSEQLQLMKEKSITRFKQQQEALKRIREDTVSKIKKKDFIKLDEIHITPSSALVLTSLMQHKRAIEMGSKKLEEWTPALIEQVPSRARKLRRRVNWE